MSGRGRTVVAPSVIGSGPTGDPFPYRNVDPGARQYLSQYAYLRGADAIIASVPSLGLPSSGGTGPDWSAVGTDPALPPPEPAPAAGGDDGVCCG